MSTPVLDLEPDKKISYPGIGRAAYLLGPIAAYLLFAIFLPPESSLSPTEGIHSLRPLVPLNLFIFLIFILFGIVWPILRLRNIGKSAWYILLLFVPLANIYIILLCAIAPPGYAQTQKLDNTAIVLALLFLAPFFALFISMLSTT